MSEIERLAKIGYETMVGRTFTAVSPRLALKRVMWSRVHLAEAAYRKASAGPDEQRQVFREVGDDMTQELLALVSVFESLPKQ